MQRTNTHARRSPNYRGGGTSRHWLLVRACVCVDKARHPRTAFSLQRSRLAPHLSRRPTLSRGARCMCECATPNGTLYGRAHRQLGDLRVRVRAACQSTVEIFAIPGAVRGEGNLTSVSRDLAPVVGGARSLVDQRLAGRARTSPGVRADRKAHFARHARTRHGAFDRCATQRLGESWVFGASGLLCAQIARPIQWPTNRASLTHRARTLARRNRAHVSIPVRTPTYVQKREFVAARDSAPTMRKCLTDATPLACTAPRRHIHTLRTRGGRDLDPGTASIVRH